jgi:hypothetical protein
MPSISILTTPEAFLARIEPFDRLDPKTRARLTKIAQYNRYHIGQPIAMRDRFPAQIRRSLCLRRRESKYVDR